MSWSFTAIGNATAVLNKAQEDINAMICIEPEQSIKASVVETLRAALSTYPDGAVVQVSANGSQGLRTEDGKAANWLNVTIQPITNFVGNS